MEGGFDFCPHIPGFVDKCERSERNSYLLSPQLPSPFAPGLWWGPREQLILVLLVVGFTQTHGGAEVSPINLEGVGARTTEGTLSVTLHQLLQNLPYSSHEPRLFQRHAGKGESWASLSFLFPAWEWARRDVKCPSSKVSAREGAEK